MACLGIPASVPPSDNILDRAFEASAPNQKWIADFTYIWTAEGWLYVTAIVDLFSRRVVGWAMKAEMTAPLVTDALLMASWRRGKPISLLHHSDQVRVVVPDVELDDAQAAGGGLGEGRNSCHQPVSAISSGSRTRF